MAGALARIIGELPSTLGGLLDDACDERSKSRGQQIVQVVASLDPSTGAPGGPAGGTPDGRPSGGGGGMGGMVVDLADLLALKDVLCKLVEARENDRYPFCDPAAVNALQQIAMRQCQRRYDDCYLQDIIRAIGDTTWVQVEDQIARSEMYFQIVSTLTGAGLNAKGTATVFNPAMPLAPGQSVLLVQDLSYPLPWYPDCFWAQLAFAAGTPDQNYPHVLFKFWVADKTANITSQAQLFEWQKKQHIKGSRVHCGDGCSWVPVLGPSGCGGAFDKIGKDSALFLQIDNLATASNAITSVDDIIVRFGHMVEPCCDNCAVGKSCGIGCKGKKH